jgi:hypothetical protein
MTANHSDRDHSSTPEADVAYHDRSRRQRLYPYHSTPEPQRLTDLRPMALTRTPAPLVLPEQRRIDFDLLGQVRHSLFRYLSGVLREPAIDLKKFQQRGEPQAGCPRLATDQLPVGLDQRPGRDQILGPPLTRMNRQLITKPRDAATPPLTLAVGRGFGSPGPRNPGSGSGPRRSASQATPSVASAPGPFLQLCRDSLRARPFNARRMCSSAVMRSTNLIALAHSHR